MIYLKCSRYSDLCICDLEIVEGSQLVWGWRYFMPYEFWEDPGYPSKKTQGNLRYSKSGKDRFKVTRTIDSVRNSRILLKGTMNLIWQKRTMRAACNSLSGGKTRGTDFLKAREHLANYEDYVRAHGYAYGCGVYMVKDPSHYEFGLMARCDSVVIAYCSAWGNVLELEHGYRVEYARLERLWLRPSKRKPNNYTAAALEKSYGVPCEEVSQDEVIKLLGLKL